MVQTPNKSNDPTSLVLSVKYPAIFDYLLEHGADLNAVDKHGRTALIAALSHSNGKHAYDKIIKDPKLSMKTFRGKTVELARNSPEVIHKYYAAYVEYRERKLLLWLLVIRNQPKGITDPLIEKARIKFETAISDMYERLYGQLPRNRSRSS